MQNKLSCNQRAPLEFSVCLSRTASQIAKYYSQGPANSTLYTHVCNVDIDTESCHPLSNVLQTMLTTHHDDMDT